MFWSGMIIGLFVGAIALALILGRSAPGMMLVENQSRLGYGETVQAIQDAAVAAGWKVPAVHELSETVNGAGFDVRPVTIIELCKPDLAGRILSERVGYTITPLMPCRVAVYENGAGEVVLARMNTGLMSKLFGRFVETTMKQATAETEAMFANVTAN